MSLSFVRRWRRTLVSCFALSFGVLCSQEPPPPKAPEGTLIIIGKVLTMDSSVPEAEAVLCRDGRIARTLSALEASELAVAIGAEVIVVPPGGVAMPGVIESHAHFLGVGRERRTLDLKGTRSLTEVSELVRARAQITEPGQWILGRGWNQEAWPERRFPNAGALDAASPDHPCVLTRIDGHAVWANRRALEAAGITDQTPSPPGGEILRDDGGKVTGILVDNAMDLLTRSIPSDSSPAETLKDFLAAQEAALSNGITTFVDAGTSIENLFLLHGLYADERMKLRMYAMLSVDSQRDLDQILERPPIPSLYQDRVAVRSLKLYADGALGSRGALLMAPYSDRTEHSGLRVLDAGFVESAARAALRRGYQVCVHAIGDGAVTQTLDAFERALKDATQEQRINHRFRVEHAQIIDPKDIRRFRQLGIYPSMQTCHATSDGPWVENRLGPARTFERAYPWRALLDSGAIIPNGTDAPVERLSPFENLFSAVTRFVKGSDGSFVAFTPHQRMNRQEAMESLTTWGAHGIFAENRLGKLRPGFWADLIILDRNPMTCSAWDLPTIAAQATIIAGKVAWRR